MSIETELLATLESKIFDKSVEKPRNIEMIAYHFGFRGAPWPTLEQTGYQFGVDTRERVRQVIAKHFKHTVELADIPALEECYQVVKSQDYWRYSELSDTILRSGLAGDNFHIEGIFNLIGELQGTNDYRIYTPELKVQSRYDVAAHDERFVIAHPVVGRVGAMLHRARRAPGLRGMAKLEDLDDGSDEGTTYRPLLRDLIRHSKQAWTTEQTGTEWYLFEDRKGNVLANYNRKVFSLIGVCDIDRLATAYRDALYRRSHPLGYPPVEVVRLYLGTSRNLELIGNQVTYSGPRDRELTPIEGEVVKYLRTQGSSSYAELRDYLSEWYDKPSIVKAVTRSPLVYVDRSGGRMNHTYSLVETFSLQSEPDRYTQIRRRLLKLDNTDVEYEERRRREQGILRDWLFQDKSRETCALCGDGYPVSALVAAHKKRRVDCSTVERLDPYVVMPLCLFGCDFLYEEHYVRVVNGKVVEGIPLVDREAAGQYLTRLIGRELDAQWREGSESYFAWGWS